MCPTLRDGDDEVARQWASGRLSPEAANEFEAHLLTCGRCQRAVESAAALATALRAPVVEPDQRGHRTPWAIRRWSIPVAIAAGVVTIALWPRDPFARLKNPGPAPAFTPASIRAGGEVGGAADRGMAAYQRRDYREAAALLGEAAAGQNATSGLRFFLGVSRLLAGDAAGAIPSLQAAVSDDAGPYAPEAHLWLGRAWLRSGAPDSAVRVLEALTHRTDAPDLAAHGRALADSIREVRPR